MTVRSIELSIGGMTCASCSRRVEKALTKIDGVSATVNYATGEAQVQIESSVTNSDVIAAVEKSGYSAVINGRALERYGIEEYQSRLVIAIMCAAPVVAISMVSSWHFSGWQWATGLLTLPLVTWVAWPLHRAAVINARHRAVTMDTLVSSGIFISFFWSLYVLIFNKNNMSMTTTSMWSSLFATDMQGTYFEVSASVTTLVILGKYLELRARSASVASIEKLALLNPKTATLVREDQHVEVALSEIKVGDIVFVPTGSQIPLDGVVIEGNGHVDSSMLTGESMPQTVALGDDVIGATALVDGALTIEVRAIGSGTVLASISRLVHQAQSDKAIFTRTVDRVSAIFVPIVMLLALLTFAVWLMTGHDVSRSISVGISVLVIACPCALGLATPTAILVGTGRGASLGLLIRGAGALEASQKISVMFLDKTGTLTEGRMSVSNWVTTVSQNDMWKIVGGLESTVVHPIAKSLVKKAEELGTPTSIVTNVHSFAGRGVQGLIDGQPASIGTPQWLGVPDGPLAEARREYENQGASVVVVYQDATAIGVIALADKISQDSQRAINQLHDMNIKPIVISGDHESAVANVSQKLGIQNFYYDITPEKKLLLIGDAQKSGDVVAMVGDGINDAAALAGAHLSLAMGAGADVAASAADIVLMRSTMSAAVDGVRLAQATMRTIKMNLVWAFAYNIAAVPLAMAGVLNPMVASAAMAFSSVFVVTNSLRLRNFI